MHSNVGRLLYDATLGLQHVHRHGLVHADVKPDNFLLKTLPGGGFSAKIADFGLTLGERVEKLRSH